MPRAKALLPRRSGVHILRQRCLTEGQYFDAELQIGTFQTHRSHMLLEFESPCTLDWSVVKWVVPRLSSIGFSNFNRLLRLQLWLGSHSNT